MPNYNPETGVAYGVASMNGLKSWLWDEIVTHGRNLSAEGYVADCAAEGIDEDDIDWDGVEFDEPAWEATIDGIKVGIDWLGGAPLLWVFESPHIVEAPACSPCVPGAGDLDSIGGASSGGSVRCYSIPDDWRNTNS